MNLVIAQLAFANSDMAFQGTHLFQGNFYGMNIFDISNPANTKLLTSMVCPGGQGDVSVYKNLMFMSVEMPNGRLDCGVEGFPPEPPPPADADKDKDKDKEKKRSGRFPRRRKIVSAACAFSIFPTFEIQSKSPRCRLAAGRTRIRLCSIPMTKTTCTSTSPAHRLCGSRKNWRDALAKSRIRIRTRRYFELK